MNNCREVDYEKEKGTFPGGLTRFKHNCNAVTWIRHNITNPLINIDLSAQRGLLRRFSVRPVWDWIHGEKEELKF